MDESSSLKELRTQIGENPTLNGKNLDESFLLKFLRARDYNVAKAYTSLKTYARLVEEYPDVFSWNNSLQVILESDVHRISKARTKDGIGISYMRASNWEPSKVVLKDLMALITIVLENELLDERIQKNGFYSIVDGTGIKLNHVYSVGIRNYSLIPEVFDIALPYKLNRVFIIYSNWLVNFAFSLVKPFLSEEIKSKLVFVHQKDLKTIHESIEKEKLSPLYGGTFTDDYSVKHRLELLEKNRELIESFWKKFRKIPDNNNQIKNDAKSTTN